MAANLHNGSFECLFHLQVGDKLLVLAVTLVCPHAPCVAQHAAEASRQVP